MGYQKVVFHATDAQNQDIYHTNVMMALGETFVVICMDTVHDARERSLLVASFAETDKEMIEISLDQMNKFAGNMLQVRNDKDETILVMSEQAYRALDADQIRAIESETKILYSDISTIETYGGGSARCMMAEVFLPKEWNLNKGYFVLRCCFRIGFLYLSRFILIALLPRFTFLFLSNFSWNAPFDLFTEVGGR